MKTKSIQEQVQQEIDLLSKKKRKHMTSSERVRLLQLKLYLKPTLIIHHTDFAQSILQKMR